MFYVYNSEYENPNPTEFISESEIKVYDENILN